MAARRGCRSVYLFAHHIYAKKKRREIPVLARRLSLRGFLVTGKPGYICVQGSCDNVSRFLTNVKKWPWQILQVRVTSERLDCSCIKGENSLAGGCYEDFKVVGAPPGGKSNVLDLLGVFRAENPVVAKEQVEELVGYKVHQISC